MMILIDTDIISEQYVSRVFRSQTTSEILNVDIVHSTDAMKVSKEIGKMIMCQFLEFDIDRLKLANKLVDFCIAQNRNELKYKVTEMVKSWDKSSRTVAVGVRCIETGEIFRSINATVEAHKLTYSALYNHLKGSKGHKSVRGQHYEYV